MTLASLVSDAGGATTVRAQLHDDQGHSMDGLKVITGPQGGYLGVYHFRQAGTFVTALATSANLVDWVLVRDLSAHASQPTIVALAGGGFLVAVEADNSGLTAHPSRWLRFLHYPGLDALTAGRSDRAFDAPDTLGSEQGTPGIDSVTAGADLSRSTVQVTFHYMARGTDREARGTLRGFTRWSAAPDTALDAALDRAGATGKHGDRDAITYRGRRLELVEAQDHPDGRWRVYLYDRVTRVARQVVIRTPKGSQAEANPTISDVLLPDGTAALVMTVFIPQDGAAPGEAGELLYVRRLDAATRAAPLVVAAGDIACPPAGQVTAVSCQQAATARLVEQVAPDAVFALGDLQYEHATLDNLDRSYAATWGRFKAITHPVIGDHDEATTDGTADYFSYWGKAAGQNPGGYYSFDLGTWHVVALHSDCDDGGSPCAPNSAQGRWLAHDLATHGNVCTLGIWHRPLFSSGQQGGNPDTQPLWDAAYSAGVDAVLDGDDHDYERFRPQTPTGALDETHGVTEFVVGTGGKSAPGFGHVDANSAARIGRTFGVLVLLLKPDGYDWRFMPVSQGGQPGASDAGSAACH